jgi:hypothetical protein
MPGAAGKNQFLDFSCRGHEIMFGIFGVDAAFYRMT